MHLSEESFQLAHTDFFEAFKCFDEAGSPRRISSLKYLGNIILYTLYIIHRAERPRGLRCKVFLIGLKIRAYTNFGSLIPNMWLVFAYVP